MTLTNKLQRLLSKYIRSTESVFAEIKIVEGFHEIDEIETRNVIEAAKRYLEDAKYYMENEKFETALASVAYCEGLLDALQLLGVVEFTWPSAKEKP